MEPIERAEMGDVWPAVEPGQGAGDYGSARLEPTAPCEIRSFQTLKITYTVGHFGLDDTGGIMIGLRWVNDCGPLQTDDPAAMNYISATASNGVALELFVEPYGYRPWTCAVRVTVRGGFMREGDTIRIVFGDRAGGSEGLRMQTIAEAAFEFKVSVDACATGQFNPLDDPLHLPIVAGPPVVWRVVAPGLRRPGETFGIGVRVEDRWGNPALPDQNDLRLEADGPVSGLPQRAVFAPGTRAVWIDGLSVAQEGRWVVRLVDATGQVLARSNPILVRDGPNAGYWGDLHGQSGETVGIGTIDEYLGFARDVAFLDVSGHQGNDFQITNAFWDKINRTTARLNEDGRFVVFPGYEWSGNTPVGGDHNVFYAAEQRPIRRSSHAMLTDRSDLGGDATTLDALFDAMRGEDVVIWSHVGGRPADVRYAHDPALKTAVEVHSNWGTFEWILTDSLALGHRVGVVANSDGHKGRPGAGPPGATEFGAYGGLTCFLAPELTRDALFECMRRRHHYGTSGARIALDVRARFAKPAALFKRDPRCFDGAAVPVDEAIMGDIVQTEADRVTLSVDVDAPAPIERVDVLQGSALIGTLRNYDTAALGNRVRVLWQGAEYRGRGRNTTWTGEITIAGGAIDRMVPVNKWNHERPLDVLDGRRLIFEAVTSGNFGGVDLMLSGDDAQIEITTNHVAGKASLKDLGLEDVVLDAGGLERQIRLRRLPDVLEACRMKAASDVPLAPGADVALWVRVTTLDGHQAWSSPIYIRRV